MFVIFILCSLLVFLVYSALFEVYIRKYNVPLNKFCILLTYSYLCGRIRIVR